MNIFILDTDPTLCAQYHCNKHVVKMIAESVQLLSTAHRVLVGEPSVIKHPANCKQFKLRLLPTETFEFTSVYNEDKLTHSYDYSLPYLKQTHENHPCAIWARSSLGNYYWLVRLTEELCKEYTHRYGKVHMYERTGLISLLQRPPTTLSNPEMTPFAQTMPEVYQDDDAVTAYRRFYINDKQRMLEYKNRSVPEWLQL